MRKLIMTKSIYESHEGARKATSDFYKSESGFSYSDLKLQRSPFSGTF